LKEKRLVAVAMAAFLCFVLGTPLLVSPPGFAIGNTIPLLIEDRTIDADFEVIKTDLGTLEGVNPIDVFSASQAPDYWPTEGWLQSTADEQGMDGTLLEEMLSYCDDWDLALQGIMVVRNGYNVLEEYPDSEFDESTLSNTWSVTKSIISILIGIALEEGYISSLDETMISFFPDRTIANLDSQKESITLRHLLAMKSGLQWSTDDTNIMRQSSDWVQYALDRPMSHTPGETWNYNNGAAHILSAILNNSIGMTPSAFAEIHLFQPLGIDEYEWEVDPKGLNSGGRGLQLTLQDMAKIGFLYINNGTWDAEQIVSSEWVENSTKVYSTGCAGAGVVSEYGHLWWVKSSYNGYCAFGTDGQFVWVFPQHNMVFVTKASRLPPINHMIAEYILPSVGWIPTPEGIDPLIIGVIGGIGVGVVIILILFFVRKR
jgi:CubicO group peptidase (beta-lactamase class C family)